MKLKTNLTVVALAFVLLVIASCSKMDDYLKYTGGKEMVYTGKVDSVKARSGRERVVITGLLTSDPNITRVKIFYNQRRDSILLDISRSLGVDTLNVPVSLPEGSHNFEIISYDSKGTPSVKVLVTGRSYGATYQESLFNRVIKNAEKQGNDVFINLYSGDVASPFTKFTYTDVNDKEKSVLVTNDSSRVVLKNYKSMSKFRMQTFFLPDTMAIDTFYAAPEMIAVSEDVTSFYIKNSGQPFLRSDNGTGKWGIIKDWLYTPNVLNQNGNTAGGWSTDGTPKGVIHFESKDWGGEGLTNGKIYQTFVLAEGKYEMEYYSDGCGGSINSNFVVARGNVLPDIDKLDDQNEVLRAYRSNENNTAGTHKIEFTLNQPVQVAVGWVVSTGSTTWLHFNYIKLRIVAELQ